MATVLGHDTELISSDWRISGGVYRDPAIFEAEMATVFARCWVFVAHESQVPEGGDYRTAFVGRQPVIVSRSSDDGTIAVLFNRCRHRGSAVCQREHGNANAFRCAYHGWTYANDGRLIGVPFQDGYGEDFDKSAMGLVPLPRVASYRGFIFACLDPDVVELEEYLGHGRDYLDFIADLDPDGIELSAGAQKLRFEANWKLQMENTIDAYHFSFTHKSWLDILKSRTGKSADFVQNVKSNPAWRTLDLGDGHCVHEYASLADARAGAHGVAVGDLLPFNATIFPSLSFVGAHLRLVVPKAVDATEVSLFPIIPKGRDATGRSALLRDHEAFYGPSGHGTTDDVEVAFGRVTRGLSATATSEDWVLMSRGLGREAVDPETGIMVGRSSDEVPQRAFYRRWHEVVTGAGV
jgi:nitrite reductase/ring-hydroxylating ferredoxin subunit